MSSSVSLNLTGVGEEIAVAVSEAMRKQQATFQCQTAGIIAKQVSEQVAAALETALLDLQVPTLDVREQILANVNFMLACYQGSGRFEKGITIVILRGGEQNQNYASVVSNVVPIGRTSLQTIPRGPLTESDTQALRGLLEEIERALTRALELRESQIGFYEISDATKKR